MKRPGRVTLIFAVVASLMWSLSAAAQTVSFGVAPSFPAGISPTSVAAGDFNGDGKPDVAVTNQQGALILLNNGSGGFTTGASYVLGTNPQSVAVGDFNGDGRPDLAIANQGSGTVSILLGNGDGTFITGTSPLAGINPRLVLVSDFNGDGKPDLAVVDSGAAPGTSGVSILLGNGDGSFQSATFVAAGSVSLSATIGDFNADGQPDLAVVNEGSDNISILLGSGNGTFAPAVNISLDQPGISVSPTSIVTADFNQDGKLDLAVATPNVHDIAVLAGNGDGTFGAPVHYALDDPNFVNNISKLAVVNLNGDGFPDLILSNLSSNHMTVLLGRGDGTFPSASSYAAGPEPIGIAIADFNGDGHPDIVAADFAVDGEVTLLLGSVGGTLQAAPVRRSGYVPTSLGVGDFNGDGKLDLVTASSVTPAPSGLGTGVVMLGNADGTFQAPKIWSTSAISSVAVGDLDGDGKLDIVETNPTPGNGNVSVLLGKGDGTFQSAANYTVGTTPETVAVADLNGDGKPDVIVGNRTSLNISVLLNSGNGTLGTAINYATPPAGTPESIAVGDFNADGKPDLAVAISGINATSIALFLGNGDGSFQSYISIPSGFHSSAILHIVAADFDGDGKTDIAVTDGITLSVLLSSGNAAFQNPVTYLVGPGAAINGTLVVGDFNGDGKPDLVTSSRDGLAVLINNGGGAFQPAIPYSPFLGGAIAVGDFYGNDVANVFGYVGDGTPDIIAANSSQDSTTTDTVAVIPNQYIGPQVTVTVQTSPTGLPFAAFYGFPPGGIISEYLPCPAAPCTYNGYFGVFFQIYANSTVPGPSGVQYAIDHFSDNGFTTTGSAGEIIHNVQVLTVPVTVTVFYKSQYQVTVVASPPQGGTVSPVSGNFYDIGTQVPLLATPNPGYTFVSWTGVIGGLSGYACYAASCPWPAEGVTTWTANFAPQTVSVPNVVGQTQAAATAAITGAGLLVGTVTTASSTTVPSGSVISESPAAGATVNGGSPVNLVISSGPPDTTPPVITPQIAGTAGNNGWYLSSVTVTWSVTDPESGIASSTGCGPTTLTATTTGTTLTCSAKNGAGLSNSASTTIKVDLTPPTLTVPATITVNATSSAGAAVTYSVTATDVIDPSPVVSCAPASGSTFPIGTTTVTCTATAVSGNRSTATFSVVVNQPQTGGSADLALSGLASPLVRTGRDLTYLIEVENRGPNTASQVTVKDVLPPGTTLVSASWAPEPCTLVGGLPLCSIPSGGMSCASAGNTVACTIGNLAPMIRRNSTGAVVRIVVQVTAAPGSIIRNAPTVGAANPDGNLNNNSATVTTRVSR